MKLQNPDGEENERTRPTRTPCAPPPEKRKASMGTPSGQNTPIKDREKYAPDDLPHEQLDPR